MEVSDQLHDPIYPWGKSYLYPLERRLGGPQSGPEHGDFYSY